MKSIKDFYKNNELKIKKYDRDSIEKLIEIIEREIINYDRINNWEINVMNILNEIDNFFGQMSWNYIYYIDLFIKKLKELEQFESEESKENKESKESKESIPNPFNGIIQSLNKKIYINIQMLEHLKIFNHNPLLFFDNDKYNVVINSYRMFGDLIQLSDNIKEILIEWNSNNYLFFYIKRSCGIKICIYHYDDIFGYKLFLTFINIPPNIKINIYDIIINKPKDIKEKIRNEFVIPTFSNEKKYFINLNQIIEYINNTSDPHIIFNESCHIGENKMIEYIKDFFTY